MRILLLILLALWIVSLQVLATPLCDCFDYPEHLGAFRESQAIFIGQVVKIDKKAELPDGLESDVSYALTFKVERRWKGAKNARLIAWEHREHTLCSHCQFQVGGRYFGIRQSI